LVFIIKNLTKFVKNVIAKKFFDALNSFFATFASNDGKVYSYKKRLLLIAEKKTEKVISSVMLV